MPWLITVLPLRTAGRHMVHHLTDKYTRTTEVTMLKPDAFLRAAANFSGSRPVTLLGARRRRPSKKLELERRERQEGAAGGPVADLPQLHRTSDWPAGPRGGTTPATPLPLTRTSLPRTSPDFRLLRTRRRS